MSIRDSLRQATKVHHQRLHDHPALAGILTPHYPLSRYLSLLQGFTLFYQAVEAELPATLEGFSYEPRRKLPWLTQDLQYFQLPLPSPSTASVPLLSQEQQIGTLYVIEGSTLGGQVIAGHLLAHLGVEPAKGGRFYHGYGPDTASHWQAFTGLLDCLESQLDEEATVAAAKRTFDYLVACLEGY